MKKACFSSFAAIFLLSLIFQPLFRPVAADTAALNDPNLEVTVFLENLLQPIGIVFIGPGDALILEKGSGQIKRAINGIIQNAPVLDLAVNKDSEYGLVSATLHPNFPSAPYVYVRWTQSGTGGDDSNHMSVPLMGNRLDRYVWNGSSLSLERPILTLRALQDGNVDVLGHPGSKNPWAAGNHNGGPMAFGPDGKLYVFVGDLGRRSWLQNLPNGPFKKKPFVDDQYGGPQADNLHFSGVILRLNADGSAPSDNPFYSHGVTFGGEVGANLRKIFSYGHRNGFGIAFDPLSGNLWISENGDDAFSEINRITPAMNGGWIQVMGPLSRFAQFRSIEVGSGSLQEVRFPPSQLANKGSVALSKMFQLNGSKYVDPEFSWKYDVAPAGTAFVAGDTLGAEYNGTLWVGSGRSFGQQGGTGGSLFRFRLSQNRSTLDLSGDSRLADRVADNAAKFGLTESETLIVGTGFGVTPDIKQGPDGNLYVVSYTEGKVYRISRK